MLLSIGSSVRSKEVTTWYGSFNTFAAEFVKPQSAGISLKDFEALSNPKEKLKHKDGRYYTPGHMSNDIRAIANVGVISVVVLDIEDQGKVSIPLVFPYNFIFHTTFRHSETNPRYHLIVEAGVIPLAYYPEAVEHLASEIGLTKLTTESKVVAQPMFFPKVPIGSTYHRESRPMGGRPFDISAGSKTIFNKTVKLENLPANEVEPTPHNDLSKGIEFITPIVPDLGENDVAETLSYLDPDLAYPNWVTTAAAVRHQFKDDPETGFQLFNDWSKTAQTKYSGEQETRDQYFLMRPEPDDRKPITFRTILDVARAKGLEWPKKKVQIKTTPSLDHPEPERFEGQPIPNRWYSEFVYVTNRDEFFCLKAGEKYGVGAFDRAFGRELVHAEQDPMKVVSKPKHTPSNFCLNTIKIPKVSNYCYLPMENPSKLFYLEKRPMINTYIAPAYLYNGKGELNAMEKMNYEFVDYMLNAHLDWMFTDPEHRQIFGDFLAYMVQNPGEKICWAIILQGAQGCGKTFWVNVMSQVLGYDNVSTIDVPILKDKWTDWAMNTQFVVVEEIHLHGESRFEVMDKLKPFVTNETIAISERFQNVQTIKNVLNMMLLTNSKQGVALDRNERRYCYLKCRVQTREQRVREKPDNYFDDLFKVCLFPKELTAFFKKWKISKSFKPKAEAPQTVYNQELEELSRSELDHYVSDLISDNDNPLLSTEMVSSTEIVTQMSLNPSMTPKPSIKRLSTTLLNMGYVKKGRYRFNKARHTLWAKEEIKDKYFESLVQKHLNLIEKST